MSGAGSDPASRYSNPSNHWIPAFLPDGQPACRSHQSGKAGLPLNGHCFASFPRKRESRKSAMVDSRLRGSDIVVRPINYPKAKLSCLVQAGGQVAGHTLARE